MQPRSIFARPVARTLRFDKKKRARESPAGASSSHSERMRREHARGVYEEMRLPIPGDEIVLDDSDADHSSSSYDEGGNSSGDEQNPAAANEVAAEPPPDPDSDTESESDHYINTVNDDPVEKSASPDEDLRDEFAIAKGETYTGHRRIWLVCATCADVHTDVQWTESNVPYCTFPWDPEEAVVGFMPHEDMLVDACSALLSRALPPDVPMSDVIENIDYSIVRVQHPPSALRNADRALINRLRVSPLTNRLKEVIDDPSRRRECARLLFRASVEAEHGLNGARRSIERAHRLVWMSFAVDTEYHRAVCSPLNWRGGKGIGVIVHAASMFDREALYKLACIMLALRGDIDRWCKVAIMLLRVAAHGAHVAAQTLLGALFYRSTATPHNVPRALYWARTAILAGDPAAAFLHANIVIDACGHGSLFTTREIGNRSGMMFDILSSAIDCDFAVPRHVQLEYFEFRVGRAGESSAAAMRTMFEDIEESYLLYNTGAEATLRDADIFAAERARSEFPSGYIPPMAPPPSLLPSPGERQGGRGARSHYAALFLRQVTRAFEIAMQQYRAINELAFEAARAGESIARFYSDTLALTIFRRMLYVAMNGHIGGCYAVGAMYMAGFGTKRHEGVAVKWLTIAALNGHLSAATLLGQHYARVYEENVTHEDKFLAGAWLSIAARNGDPVAMYSLGSWIIRTAFLDPGDESHASYHLGQRWFEAAEKCGHVGRRPWVASA